MFSVYILHRIITLIFSYDKDIESTLLVLIIGSPGSTFQLQWFAHLLWSARLCPQGRASIPWWTQSTTKGRTEGYAENQQDAQYSIPALPLHNGHDNSYIRESGMVMNLWIFPERLSFFLSLSKIAYKFQLLSNILFFNQYCMSH